MRLLITCPNSKQLDPPERKEKVVGPRKERQLSIVTFIDALGWEILRERQFMENELPFRRPLRSVLGFSSACVPSILTGRLPRDHGHWSFFYKSDGPSPLRGLRWLRCLPSRLTDKGRVRGLISRYVAKLLGFTGYFQLYNIPFQHIDRFDYCEKRDLFRAGGINNGQNIFEYLTAADIPFHVSEWRDSEPENISSLKTAIGNGEIEFAFLYLAAMDSLLHQVGKGSLEVDKKLAWYEQQLRELFAFARQHYDEVRLFVCSDHGMATVHTHVDLMSKIERLPFRFGQDYVATYDSTMARFWFENADAEVAIREALESVREGRVLSRNELEALGCDFERDQYGELIFLLDAGSIIVPSHMGTKPITGMHGYHPDHADSDAVLLSNVLPPNDPRAIIDVFKLMLAESGA